MIKPILFGSTLLLLVACADHVTEAEEFLEETKSSQNYEDYKTNLNENYYLKYQFRFPTTDVGSSIDSLQVVYESPFLDNSTPIQFGFQGIQTPIISLDKQSLGVQMNLSVDSLQDPYIDHFYLYLESPRGSEDTLINVQFDEATLHKAHQIFNSADNKLADDGNATLSSLLQSLKHARTHAKLALKGKHQTHFKHTAQFLYGREGRNPKWAEEAFIASVDTISVTEQLIYVQQYLVDQAKWSTGEHSDAILELKDSLSHFHDSLIVQMDEIEEWTQINPDSIDNAQHKAQHLIDILERSIPQVEELIKNISPHLVREIHVGVTE